MNSIMKHIIIMIAWYCKACICIFLDRWCHKEVIAIQKLIQMIIKKLIKKLIQMII
jgi:hypothetical protein